MSPDLDDADICWLLDALDLRPQRVSFHVQASTSAVWRADTTAGPVAVRVLVPRPGKHADIDGDLALRRHLRASRDLPVARPLADHRSRPDLAVAGHRPDLAVAGRRPDLAVAGRRPAWAVDEWIDGEPADASADTAVWRALGAVLAALHALPTAGHGRLVADGDALAGRRSDLDAGIADRFENPWPFTGRPLAEHLLADAAPDLAARLAGLEGRIREAATARPVVTHGDLNGANVRHAGGRLRGLIDFADATVLAPAWDFGSLRYFQGPEVVDRVLEGYTGDASLAAALARDAGLLAPVVAVHHVGRARTISLPQRHVTALARLRRDLDALGA